MDTIKQKKIYYIPGIISLTILPILFYFYNDKYQKASNQTVIQLFVWDPNLPKKYPGIFTDEYPPKRKYEEIFLTGDNTSDKIKLDFSQIRVREILTQNDSINGVHFYFGENAQYRKFIKALDIFKMEQAKNYMVYENDICSCIIRVTRQYKTGFAV